MSGLSVARIISVNGFSQNSYLFFNEHIMCLVDCGCTKDAFFETIKAHSLMDRRLNAIFLTHTHFDHITGLYDIWQDYKCDVYISKGCEDFIYDKIKNASLYFGGFCPSKIYPESIKSLDDKENIFFGNLKVVAYKSPGHSLCSVCYLVNNILFTGDTVLDGSVGRTDLYGGSNKELLTSLKKIKKIPFESAYPGHGDKMSKDMVYGIINFYVN